MTENSGSIRVIALGGYGQIGMNCTLIESCDRLLVLDCGVAFCNEPKLGADYRHPSFEYLRQNIDRIEAIVLSHGHEDHIAAISHLPPELHVPVFGGPCTLGLVAARLSETGAQGRFPRQTVFPGVPFRAGPFQLTAIRTPHSILDNYSYLLETAGRRILFTGDYKLDRLSREGGRDVLAALTALRPLDLMIGDSTGAFELQDAGDEGVIGSAAAPLLSGTRGRVYVALFSSNVGRIGHLTRVAQQVGRRVAFAGRSMENHLSVAVSAGRAPSTAEQVIPVDDLGSIPRGQSLVFVSGSQGEPLSALHRLAEGTHRTLDIQPGDAVLFSSRAIPGNELAVSRIVDQLIAQGADVYDRHTHPMIHASGHGSAGEIRSAIDAARPRAYIPAHGTAAHLRAASRIAAEAGVARIGVILNGDAATWDGEELAVVQRAIPADVVTVENGRLVPESVLREREILGNRGFVQIELRLRPDGDLSGTEYRFTSRGAFGEEQLPEVTEELTRKIEELLVRISDGEGIDPATIADSLRNPLRRHLQKIWRADPYLIISVLR